MDYEPGRTGDEFQRLGTETWHVGLERVLQMPSAKGLGLFCGNGRRAQVTGTVTKSNGGYPPPLWYLLSSPQRMPWHL
jgi:hypothetical protein